MLVRRIYIKEMGRRGPNNINLWRVTNKPKIIMVVIPKVLVFMAITQLLVLVSKIQMGVMRVRRMYIKRLLILFRHLYHQINLLILDLGWVGEHTHSIISLQVEQNIIILLIL